MSPRIKTYFGAAVITCSLFVVSTIMAIAGDSDIPVLNADIGSCSVHFTVKDPENKPIYNAKIRTTIRYGFLSMRKLSLEVSTNSDGRAKITGLPESPKKEFEFEIISGNFYKQASSFPSSKCEEDKIDITFKAQDLRNTE